MNFNPAERRKSGSFNSDMSAPATTSESSRKLPDGGGTNGPHIVHSGKEGRQGSVDAGFLAKANDMTLLKDCGK